jgi:ribosomal protein S18 acetylase RimI-like enzyme
MNNSISPLQIQNDALLDNPVWHSLAGHHAHLAVGAEVGRGLARRYPPEIGPLAALQEATPEAYAELAAVVPEGDLAILFFEDTPAIPAGWQLLRRGTLVQMVCPAAPEEPALAEAIVPLEAADYPEMVALTALTEPGPFRAQTAQLGGFVGIRVDGRLAAMGGQRMSLEGFAEVSAVCTHPEFRGRGFAQALVATVARTIHAAGRTPFLTAFATNTGAIRVYEQVGFVARRRFELAVVRPPSAGRS